jgi:hypothetical protein
VKHSWRKAERSKKSGVGFFTPEIKEHIKMILGQKKNDKNERRA